MEKDTESTDDKPFYPKNTSFKLKNFNGNGDLRQWLKKLELLAQFKNWSDEETAINLRMHLEGNAWNWHLSLNEKTLLSYKSIKEEMLTAFLPIIDQNTELVNLFDVPQKENESATNFLHRKFKDANLLNVNIDKQFLILMVNKIRDPLKNIILAENPRYLDSSESLIKLVQQKEILCKSTVEINTIKHQKQQPKSVKCFICGKIGHMARDCWFKDKSKTHSNKLTTQSNNQSKKWKNNNIDKKLPKKENNKLVCYRCGGKGHKSSVCPTPKDFH